MARMTVRASRAAAGSVTVFEAGAAPVGELSVDPPAAMRAAETTRRRRPLIVTSN